jgi:cysteine synthase
VPLADLRLDMDPTPVRPVRVRVGGRAHRLLLKLESHTPSGSVKYRTARYLLAHLAAAGLLDRPRTLVESTSGNLGVSLARLAGAAGHRFVAVVDPLLSPGHRAALAVAGADLVEVAGIDETSGSYLDARLRAVASIVEGSPDAVWVNQYGRRANPLAHYLTTGPEIVAQAGGDVDTVFVAVSTGGTFVGIRQALRELTPEVTVVAVDVTGSRALGQPPGPARRGLVTGVGASRPSAFLGPDGGSDGPDAVVVVDEVDAVATCHALATQGIDVGGSSGAVVAAACRYLAEHPLARPLCVCPDGAAFYRDTLYSTAWLATRGVTLPVLDSAFAVPAAAERTGG